MTITDRRGRTVGGVDSSALPADPNSGLAIKQACLVATTANITLSGLQTIDGVTVVESDRVLVKSQTAASENGIYNASSGNWTRSVDWDGTHEIARGTQVLIMSGTINSLKSFSIRTADPLVIGTTSLVIQEQVVGGPELAAIAALITTGLLARTGTATYATRTITAGASIGVTNGDGVSGNMTIAVTDAELVALAGLTSAADSLPYFTGSGTASLATFTAFARTLLDDADQAAMRVTLGLTPGTDVQAYDADLAALAGNSTDGLWAHTGAGTGAARTLTAPAAGITITNPAGIAGNPTLVLANDLAALEALSSAGIARRTGSDAWSAGTAVANSELATMAAFTFKGNNTSGSATPTDVDIAALTTKASPAAGDYVIISDQAASGAWKKAAVSSVSSAGSVSSWNGATGAIISYFPPQGRLTLATGVPVMTTTQSAKTTIYYTPYVGNVVPIYDGTNMLPTVVTEISVLTTDTTKSPAAIGASKINDWFVWNDAGAIRLGHGPDWTNDTTRSAGTALVMVNGILLNNASITNGPAASRGTYVGTTRSNSSNQLEYIFGASASGGTAAVLGVWNAYNRVLTQTAVVDSGLSYTYSSGTIRQARASAGNQVSFVIGLQQDGVFASYNTRCTLTAAVQAACTFGLGLDSITAYTRQETYLQTPAAVVVNAAGSNASNFSVGIGYHYIAALEQSDGANSNTFDLTNNGTLAVVVRN